MNELSDGLIGALIGGGVALAANLMTNIVIAVNLSRQHKHDSKQKIEDRKSAIRREVYPRIVDDIHALHAFLGHIQNMPIEDGSAEPYQQMLRSTGKLWVIAEYETTVLSREYVDVISEIYLKVLSNSKGVRVAVTHFKAMEKDYLVARTKRQIAESALNRVNLDRPDGIDLVGVANEFHDAQDEEHLVGVQYNAAFKAAKPLRDAYSNMVLGELARSQEPFVRVVCALRKEIGLESDEATFMRLMQEQNDRAAAAFQELIRALRGEEENAPSPAASSAEN